MIHMWILVFAIGGALSTSCSSMIAGFPDLETCEKSRLQVLVKLQVKKDKAACIEVTQGVQGFTATPPPEAPPVDQDHQ